MVRFFNGAYWCVSLQKCVHTSGLYWVRSCEGQSWFCTINPSYDVMVLEVIEIWHWALTCYYLQHPIHILLWTQWLIYFMLQMYRGFFCLTVVLYHHDSPGDKLYYVWFIFSWLIPMPENGFHSFHGEGVTHLIVWDFIHFVVQENIVFSIVTQNTSLSSDTKGHNTKCEMLEHVISTKFVSWL